VAGVLSGINSGVEMPFVVELGFTSDGWRVWGCRAHAVGMVSNATRLMPSMTLLVLTEITVRTSVLNCFPEATLTATNQQGSLVA